MTENHNECDSWTLDSVDTKSEVSSPTRSPIKGTVFILPLSPLDEDVARIEQKADPVKPILEDACPEFLIQSANLNFIDSGEKGIESSSKKIFEPTKLKKIRAINDESIDSVFNTFAQSPCKTFGGKNRFISTCNNVHTCK